MFMIIDPEKNSVIVTYKEINFNTIVNYNIRKHSTSADLMADIRKFLKGEYTDDQTES